MFVRIFIFSCLVFFHFAIAHPVRHFDDDNNGFVDFPEVFPIDDGFNVEQFENNQQQELLQQKHKTRRHKYFKGKKEEDRKFLKYLFLFMQLYGQ